MRNALLKRVEELEKALGKPDREKSLSEMTDKELLFIITGKRDAVLTDEELREIIGEGESP